MLPDELLDKGKKDGFADKYLSKLLDIPEKEIRAKTNFTWTNRGMGTCTCKRS